MRAFCGIAAAASLEGTLIAVTMGRRLGRDSAWSWAAMFAASAFTAMVAYYVHADVGLAAAGLDTVVGWELAGKARKARK